MPSGGGARQPPPKRETFRPPWVKGGEDDAVTKPSSIAKEPGVKTRTIVRPKTANKDQDTKETGTKSTSTSNAKLSDSVPGKGDAKVNSNSKVASSDDDKPRAVLRKQTNIKEGGENGVTETKAGSKSRHGTKDSTTSPAKAKEETPVGRSASRDMSSKEGLPPKRPGLPRQPSRDDNSSVKKWRDPLRERVFDNIDKTLANETPEGHTLTKNQSLRSLLKPAPPPMPPPLPPKAPPPPEFKRDPLSVDKLKRLEALKSRPRRRPDWSDMMKEVESGRKLKHVVCNDRSSPVITTATVVKTKDKFVFESEKEPVHNELLKQIEKGIRLKKTKTNDRSKPILEGLRKFRRQMTIEEQIQKSQSQANLADVKEAPPEEEEIDEMDDIDKVRDDLQSTKQLLALELRNKEAQVRENKLLQKRIENLEAELAKERALIKQAEAKTVISVTDAYDEKLVTSLKDEVSKTKNVADDLGKMYHQTAEELDETKSALEEALRKNAELEKKLQQAMANSFGAAIEDEEPESFFTKRQKEFSKQCHLLGIETTNNVYPSKTVRGFQDYYNEDQGHFSTSNQGSRRSSHAIKQMSMKESSFEEEESESDEEGEETEEKKQKKMEKEVKVMRAKLKNLVDKKDKARKEREGLKGQLKNQQQALKAERKKYKELKREVDKMAAMMKEVGDDGDGDEDDASEEEDDEEVRKIEVPETSEEEDTETEQETESETESESEPEDAPLPKKRDNLATRVKKHESALNALKKGNTLLLANVDRLKDDVNKQKEESATMQADLDSLLAELE